MIHSEGQKSFKNLWPLRIASALQSKIFGKLRERKDMIRQYVGDVQTIEDTTLIGFTVFLLILENLCTRLLSSARFLEEFTLLHFYP